MDDFDRAEESRERNEGLYYEEYHDRLNSCESCGRVADLREWTDGAIVLELCAECYADAERETESVIGEEDEE